MNKKIIITIIILLLIIGIFFNILLTKPSQPTDTLNIPTRNDTVINSYSLSEIALHNKATDCWIAIDEKVIDPTVFIAAGLHPNDKIIGGCGRDATAMFNQVDKHGGEKAKATLKQYQIGVLE